MIKNLVLWCLFLLAVPVFSQEYQNEYLQGKEFLKNERYALAMESLKPLVKPDSDNPLSKYAMYYYAVAAYNEGYQALSKNMFLQVQKLYPQWEQNDEVRLWLAKLYLEEEQVNQAINMLNNIDDPGLKRDKEAIFRSYLQNIDDYYLIEELHRQNPDNKVIGEKLAELISRQPLQNRDQEMLMALVKKFDLDAEKFNAQMVEKSVKKDVYRVAVMLPFIHERLEVNFRPKRNQFVLDMYNGIRMAVDTLKAMEVNIELYAYDTKREYNQTKKILEREELKTMDLIIGPLYPQPLELVKDFSYRHKINMLNPLSNNPKIAGNNPFAFLFKPSYSTIGAAMGEYARKNIEHPYSLVIFGESAADSALAYSYKQAFEDDKRKVIMQKIYSDNPRKVLDLLTSEGKKLKESGDPEEEVKFTIPEDSIGSLYVATDEEMIITRALSGIETRRDTVIMLGSEKWLDINAIDYSALERLGVVMASPTYVDYEKKWYKNFRQRYIRKYRSTPTEFAIIGYDAMMFAGTSLKNHGKHFQLSLQKEPPQEGFILTGYNFSAGNDNKVVPIIKVLKNEPRIVEVDRNAGNRQE